MLVQGNKSGSAMFLYKVISHKYKLDNIFAFQTFHRIGPLGRFDLVVAMSVVCVRVCLSLFAWYILRPILPPLPEVGCPKFLEIWNPWGKVLERSGLRIEHFRWEAV